MNHVPNVASQGSLLAILPFIFSLTEPICPTLQSQLSPYGQTINIELELTIGSFNAKFILCD